MLKEYGVKNFGPIREWSQISFELKESVLKKQSLANHKGLSNVLCIKGANASGKTNLLKVLSFLSFINASSFTSTKVEEKIPVFSFFGSDEPIEFYVDFLLGDVEYSFELSLTPEKILEEKLFRKVKKKSLIYHRKGLKLVEVTAEYEGLKKVNLRDNSSLICSARQFGEHGLDEVYVFFEDMMCNITQGGFTEDIFSLETISDFYFKNDKLFSFCKEVMRENDLGISDISLEERITKEDKVVYVPVFAFEIDGKIEWLPYIHQSNGTKQLYRKLLLYALALEHGGIAVIDELDAHLHPHILPHIIKKFEDKQINTKNAQLIFTCHDSAIMDIMGQYRTVLVQKKNNECFAYRLDEIEGSVIRNDRDISPLYNKGYLGGVPHHG